MEHGCEVEHFWCVLRCDRRLSSPTSYVFLHRHLTRAGCPFSILYPLHPNSFLFRSLPSLLVVLHLTMDPATPPPMGTNGPPSLPGPLPSFGSFLMRPTSSGTDMID